MKLFLVIGALLLQVAGMAQQKSFSWSDGLCDMKSFYDSRKYTAHRLGQTYKLWQGTLASIHTDATAFRLEEYDKLPLYLDSLEAEYLEVKAALVQLDPVPQPYWQKLKEEALLQASQQYGLVKATLQSYRDPAVLLHYTPADTACRQYILALITGGEPLVETWRLLVEEQCRNNASPDRLREEFRYRNGTPRRLDYARMYVTTFGWWNCANKNVHYAATNSEEQSRMFRRLFTKTVTLGCDEP